MRDKVTRLSINHNLFIVLFFFSFLKRKESRSGIEPRPLPLGQTGSLRSLGTRRTAYDLTLRPHHDCREDRTTCARVSPRTVQTQGQCLSIVFENSTATCSVFVTVVLRQPAGLFKGGALLEEEEADQEERSFLQRHISPTRVSTLRFSKINKNVYIKPLRIV